MEQVGDRPRSMTHYEGVDADHCSWEVLFLSDVAGDGDALHREIARLFVSQALEVRSVCLNVIERQLEGRKGYGCDALDEEEQAAAAAAAEAAQEPVCFLRVAHAGAGADLGEGAAGSTSASAAWPNGRAGGASDASDANGKAQHGRPADWRTAEGEIDDSRLVANGAANLRHWCSSDKYLQEELSQLATNAYRVRNGQRSRASRTLHNAPCRLPPRHLFLTDRSLTTCRSCLLLSCLAGVESVAVCIPRGGRDEEGVLSLSEHRRTCGVGCSESRCPRSTTHNVLHSVALTGH